ncbi:MAG: polysaccharide biosynthesis tyrosine autokinase [Muribaculaceae bacterium]|nr:polysaccharide biosynthesis tyrosine autokinase [Muribaculaceae bacterium]
MAKEKKETESVVTTKLSLKDLIRLSLKNWKWVALSLILCMGLAIYYLQATNPVYKREASVIIKDESDGLSLGGMVDIGMPDIGLFSGNSNFENELSTFRSPDYMEEVVRRLGLQTTYRMKEGLRKVPLYGADLPINVEFKDLDDSESAALQFVVLENEDIVVRPRMAVNGKKAKLPDEIHTRFNTWFNTPAGPVRINKLANWGIKKKNKHNVAQAEEEDEKRFYVSRMSLKDAVEYYQGQTDISKENEKGATVLNFTVKDACAARGEDILNALIDVYNVRWGDEKNQLAANTSKFIDERLVVLAHELGSVDESITDYKKRNRIIDIEASSRASMEKVAEIDKRYVEEANSLEIAKYLKDFLSNEGNKHQTLPVNLSVGSVTLESQINAYNELILQRNGLAANSSASNPLVKNYDEGLNSMRRSIISALNNQVATLTQSLNFIRKEQGINDSEIAANPDQAEVLRSLGREQTVKEQLYLFLLQKKEENEISRAFAGQNIKVIRRPGGSDKPYSPRKPLVLGFAFIFGLAFPVGFIYFKETSNTKFRSRKDVEKFDIPILGEIPRLNKKMPKESKVQGDNIVVGEGQRDVVNEAFRVTRTNLGLLTSGDRDGSVIMVTSFIPDSGKTFVSINLAVACAMKKRVVLVDCDLRKRSTSFVVGKDRKGVSDYLNGSTDDVDSLMVCDKIRPNLCILPAGTLSPNPTELLESGRFSQLIGHLREEFDYVILDCPPSEMMADSQIINVVSDRTIYVLRAGNLELEVLPLLKQYYDEKKYKNISLILNGLTEVQTGGYGYGAGYGVVEANSRGLRKLFRRK